MTETGFIAEKKRIRIAVSLVYFCMGLSFASWASRIPDIKTALSLSGWKTGINSFCITGRTTSYDACFGEAWSPDLGAIKTILFAIPVYTICLFNIGMVTAGWQLAIALFLFGLAGNLCNISINTQGVSAEKLYERPILASFHGVWSLAGFTGALIGLLMININVPPKWHFLTVLIVVWMIFWINHRFLIRVKQPVKDNEPRRKFFSKPDAILLQLGIICFCSMASEGAMFDWSGVYFKDVVKVKTIADNIGIYLIYDNDGFRDVLCLTAIISRIGRKKLLQISGIVISAGLFTSVLFPYLVPCTLAFMAVGLGVSSIVPTVYSTAGKYGKVPPGIALATVSGVGFLGFLMGPPLLLVKFPNFLD